MNNIRKMGALLGAGAVIFTLAGCADKDGGGQAESPMDANNVGGAVKDNLGDTANAVSNAGEAVAGGVSNAAGAVGDAATGAANAVGNAGSAAATTAAVKTALGANAGLKGSKIDVDSSANTVTLKGTVTSAAQKNLATAIAKKNAGSSTVNNQLTIGNAGRM